MPSSSVSQPLITFWLYGLAALIIVIILVGGTTRLTESGLSITQWQPVSGIFPPLNQLQWLQAFADYQKTDEYQRVHFWMTLDDFKTIYFWEWLHRLLGRLAGLALIIPMIFFALTHQLRRELWTPLIALLILGGLQGTVGWFMVKSGLVNAVDVSPFRLMLHLILAFVLLAFTLSLAWQEHHQLRIRRQQWQANAPAYLALAFLLALVLQIALGALVAGHNAGLIYNQWPLMGSNIIPPDYFPQTIGSQPAGLIDLLFNHPVSAQLHHRIGAYILVILAILQAYKQQRLPQLRQSAILLMSVVLLQTLLGIITLLAVSPLPLALLHQLMGVVTFILALYHLHQCLFVSPVFSSAYTSS